MGVKGLTTYIANKAELYMQPHELHDTCLVIDGDSLASNLYQWSPDTNSAYGGDYNQYHHIVTRYFAALHKCRIRSFVLLDGGYQRRKLATVHSRLRNKICSIRHLNPLGGNHLFPLQMRECFVDAVRCSAGAQLMRCMFEADDEVAQLARQLNCPVLSYDSDFYIHNVQYIPSVTLTAKPLRREAPRRNRRRPAATSAAVAATFRPYWYLDCCVYTIANLARGAIRTEVLPLFGVLLGNDYIGRHVFARFFANVSTRHVGKRNSPQQKRIIGLLRWLRGETLASAREKVLGSVEVARRGRLARDIEQAMEGYVRASSEAFVYFGLSEADVGRSVELVVAEEEVGDAQNDDDDDESDAGESRPLESDDDISTNSESDEVDDDAIAAITDNTEPNAFKYRAAATRVDASAWLRELIHGARVPRYVVDLLALKIYINAPQVENVAMRESNHIGRPILALLYTLVHLPAQVTDDLVYLTRGTKNASTFVNEKIAALDAQSLRFTPPDSADPAFNSAAAASNVSLLMETLFTHHDAGQLLNTIGALPASERLFALCLVYATHRSANLTRAHLYALLVVMFALHRTHEHCSYADAEHFQQQYRRYTDAALPPPTDGNAMAAHEAIMLGRNVMPWLQLRGAMRTRHTAFSATTVHGFAEWQAVMMHMNTLNTLLGEPFERMAIGRLFNGTLAYNLTVTLAERPDMGYYVRNYVFKDCARLAAEFEEVVGVLGPVVVRLTEGGAGGVAKKKSTRNQRKLAKKRAAKIVVPAGVGDEVTEILAERLEEEGSDYDGLGSRFAGLAL